MKTKCIFFTSLFLSAYLLVCAEEPYSTSSFRFLENKGQVIDQYGSSRSDVQFIFTEDNFKLILRSTGFSYELMKAVTDNGADYESGQKPLTLQEEEDVVLPDVHYIINRIDVELLNCNRNALIEGINGSPFHLNYFNERTGPSGITGVHAFEKIVYKNIYAGIDLVFYTVANADGTKSPKYEFMVHSAGNANDIQMAYSGQEKIAVATDGSLKLNQELGFINESQPLILLNEENKQLTGHFRLNGTIASFQKIKKQGSDFIIDPTISWGTYYGGKLKDIPDELASDKDLNIYITGRTRSTSMIATTGAHQTMWAGGDDAVLIKFDTNGNLVWATYHGGSGNDVAFAITTDLFNNIYIGGRTVSPGGIATPGAVIDTFSGGLFDVFIAKFDPAGVLQWGTYMGAELKDEVQGLATNPAGELYVSGYSESLTGISTPGSYKAVGDTAGESFLMKFTPKGQQIWGTYYGGDGRDRAHGVWVHDGHVYLAGTTNSKTGIATPGTSQDEYAKLLDCYLSQWSEDGFLEWGTYIGGKGDDRPRDVRTDDDGYLYIVGQTESEENMATPGTWKSTLQYDPGTNRDGFVEKFTPDGQRVWGTYFGGNKIEMPRSIRVARQGAPIWIGGYTKSDSGLATKDGYQNKIGGFNDGFIAKFNWDGSKLMYSSYYGGGKSESITEGGWYGSPMEMDAAGNIYLSSCTQSTDSIATPGAYKTVTGDSGVLQYDFFLVKFTDVCSDPFEPNDTITVNPAIPLQALSHSFSLKAQLQEKNDNDYFAVTTPPGYNILQVQLSQLPVDCNLFVYDSLENLVGKSQNLGLTDEFITVTGIYAGKYYILVKAPPPFAFDPVNCYQLDVISYNINKPAEDETSAGNDEMIIYPNPAAAEASLVLFSDQSTEGLVEISDIRGRVLVSFHPSLHAGENTVDLNLDKLPTGNYFVSVLSANEKRTLKLQVVK